MDGSREACAAVIAGPRVGEHLTSHHGRPERVIAFARREQTGIGRDDGSAKLKHQSGRLFDDRGNWMSPTHANKRGVRYRYYVSHAILQNRKAEAGSIARVPAPEIETLVCDSVRRHLAATGEAELPTALGDRDLIEHHGSVIPH
jgi:hypothetical protein